MNAVKLARYEKGETLTAVADATGIAVSTLSGYENDLRVPTAEKAKVLADYYGVTVVELLGLKDAAA